MNAANKNIDALLEQVAEALADGKNELAAQLLPEILQSGDEVQCLMAESYLMQIDALQALEQDESTPEESAPQSLAAQAHHETNETSDLQLQQLTAESANLDKKTEIISETPKLHSETLTKEDIISPHDMIIDQVVSSSSPSEIKTSRHAKNTNYHLKESIKNNTLPPEQEKTTDKIANNIVEPESKIPETSEPIDMLTSATNDGDINTTLKQVETSISDKDTGAPDCGEDTAVIAETLDLQINTQINRKVVSSVTTANPVDSSISLTKIKTQKQEEFTELDDVNTAQGTSADINSSEEQEINVIDTANISDFSSSTTDNEEINTALMQAEILIADKEYETAELVLQTVLDSSDDISCSKAKTMIVQIANEKALGRNHDSKAHTPVEGQEPVTSSSVIDAIFREDYEGFSNQNKDNITIIKEEPLLSDTLAIEAQIADNKTNNEENIVVIENKTIQDLANKNPIEQKVTEESNREALVAITTEDKLTEETIFEEVEETIVTEIFSDDEEVSHLLSPTLALQNTEKSFETLLKNSASPVESIQRQGFHIGDLGLMIDFASGSELTEIPQFVKIPNAPKWFVGLTNMHGVVIPIFDLQTYFSITDKSSDTNNKKMLLILKYDKSEKVFGIIVDGLPTRLTWSSKQKVNTNTSPTNIRSHINAACLIDGNLWFDLDTETLAHTLENAI